MLPSPDVPETASFGQAFRWSMLALGLAGLVVAASFWIGPQNRREPVVPVAAATNETIRFVSLPTVRFTDITRSAGITFVHQNGARGDKLLPETMGSGVAFFDFDNDDRPDLLFINSTWWPGEQPANTPPPTAALYHNEGGGRFRDVTAGSGLEVSLYGMGVAVGDYDNDGRVDVYVTAVGGNRLWHNEGNGRFRDVTAQAGVGGSGRDWSTAAAFLDYDNDGRLDLAVGNYVVWDRERDFEVNYRLPGSGRAYGPPMNFPATLPRLYHNEGNGEFRDVSARAGVQVRNPASGAPIAKTLAFAPVDIDADGWMDLVVANDTVQNFVFRNQRDGTFREIGAEAGVAFDSYGQPRGAMGIDVARFRNDDALGIAIANFANEMNALYVSQSRRLTFSDEALAAGVGTASRALLKFGLFFFDWDLDGRLDVLTVNGHLDEGVERIPGASAGQRYRQPAQLFWNTGQARGGAFTEVGLSQAGADLFRPVVGRGSAYADIDGDGDLDVVMTQAGGPPVLLRNDHALGHHWVRLRLVGGRCNRDAIGAWVKLTVGGEVQARQVMPTKSYLSQSELTLTFGLGTATRIDGIEVTWPDGTRQGAPPPPVDRLTVIQQMPEGR